MNSVQLQTHMFWAYGDITDLEKICIRSFIENGFAVSFWTYGNISNLPAGAKVCDARSILSEDQVFLNKVGSYAGFSDWFRYAVLNKFGGLYVDTDVIALKPAQELPKSQFLVTERIVGSLNGELKINGNIIFNPEPKKGNIIDLAFDFSERFPKSDITWSEIGPDLLTSIVKIHKQHNFSILAPEFGNHVDYFDSPRAFLAVDLRIPEESHFVHLYNEMWRRSGVAKNAPFPKGSFMEKMATRYL